MAASRIPKSDTVIELLDSSGSEQECSSRVDLENQGKIGVVEEATVSRLFWWQSFLVSMSCFWKLCD